MSSNNPIPDPQAENTPITLVAETMIPAAPKVAPLVNLEDCPADDAWYLERMAARARGELLGPEPFTPELRDTLCGSWPVGITQIIGGSGSGKTAFALQAAQECKTPAVYVTCEMSPRTLRLRSIARYGDVSFGDLCSASLAKVAYDRAAASLLGRAPFMRVLDATVNAATPDRITQVIERLREDSGSPYALIVIDSLHAWTRRSYTHLPEYEALARSIDDLQNLFSKLGAAILSVTERNREGEKSKSPTNLGDGAGHRLIEYGADAVLNLNVEPEDIGKPSRTVRVAFAKNRVGIAGATIPLMFDGTRQSFSRVKSRYE